MNSSRQHLGPYQLQQRLGGNGPGEVWKAFDEQRKITVAVSILHINPQEAAELIPRFLYETKNLQNLHHPNIARILDVQVAPPTPGAPHSNEIYIVTEYVEGPSLATYMASTSQVGQFPSLQTLSRIMAPVASALDYAHQNGIIHGHIKPTSIVFDARTASGDLPGEPRLVNFGLHGMERTLTLPLYDVSYISPELAQGHTENTRSDLYSLGVILYELCTGTLPFQGDSVSDVMMQQIHATPMSPVLINPRVVPGLTAIIMRCLAKEPSSRFPTVSAMAAALDKVTKSPASISMGLSNPGIALSPQQPPSLPLPGSNNPVSNPGLKPGYTPVPPGFEPVAALPAGPNSNQPSGAFPYPLVPPGPNPTNDNSPTFLTPAHSGSRAFVSSPQMTSTPPAALPQGGAYAGAPTVAARPPVRPRRRLLPLILTLALVVLVIAAGLVTVFLHPFGIGAADNRPVLGHAFFTSSGLLSQNSTNGIADGVQIDLQNLPAPQSGKAYYAWLLGDTDADSDAPPLGLGALTMQNGHAIKTFVDPQNNNLLFKYSRFLVTEEDTNAPPANPSLDQANWRYAAFFSRVPNPDDVANHYSVLDHLRHLLAQDPKLKAAGLQGGLDVWLFRNTLKILEWSGSARDAYKTNDTGLIRRQAVRILDYLDGTQLVTTENIPSDLPAVLVDPTIGKVGMFQISPDQAVPGYLKHVGNHLHEVSLSTYVTPTQRETANKMNVALNNVQGWFNTVHSAANQLIHMTPEQLQQPQTLTLLNTMFVQANAAFVGQTDPNTNAVREGVSQIHYESQSLATFDVLGCSSSNVKNFCA